ncbi:hypothetical protein PG985_013833 [Apiospora marii]|uniref:Uncharacterized protein n=1 Tax=Apiospora marii TaxID=335849 RepID=A0ABR1R6Q9_9PEZI
MQAYVSTRKALRSQPTIKPLSGKILKYNKKGENKLWGRTRQSKITLPSSTDRPENVSGDPNGNSPPNGGGRGCPNGCGGGGPPGAGDRDSSNGNGGDRGPPNGGNGEGPSDRNPVADGPVVVQIPVLPQRNGRNIRWTCRAGYQEEDSVS